MVNDLTNKYKNKQNNINRYHKSIIIIIEENC